MGKQGNLIYRNIITLPGSLHYSKCSVTLEIMNVIMPKMAMQLKFGIPM
jgi:hypothetical protein